MPDDVYIHRWAIHIGAFSNWLFSSYVIVTNLHFFERKLRFPRIITSLISPILFVLLIVGVGYFLGTQIAHFKDDLLLFNNNLRHSSTMYRILFMSILA
ncbi:hypothetical protein QW060_17325 [Myroides ceti]|uniref:Uncharacterized protein n=1 Tax=Paenimyroides ceti TaxID=395087 RepID=A0ABT8CWE4_9FLAO|nr:hypothetical protein [Paenimyroides ceti]MDN3708858.1 hypothetical protein [Paenimyroides ceti]